MVTNAEFTLTRAKGTLNYLAPECLELSEISEDQQIISKITSKVDVWAFGCIASWLFSGYVPWSDKYKDLPPIIQQILMKKIPFSIPKNIEDKNIIKIIEMATDVDVNKRKKYCSYLIPHLSIKSLISFILFLLFTSTSVAISIIFITFSSLIFFGIENGNFFINIC